MRSKKLASYDEVNEKRSAMKLKKNRRDFREGDFMKRVNTKIKLITLINLITLFCFFSTTLLAQTTAPKLNDSANQAKKQNDKSQAVSQVMGVANMAMGAMYASQCGGPHSAMACAQAALHFVMGALSFKQASSNKKASGQAALTGMDTNSNYGSNPYGDPGKEINPLDPNENPSTDPKVNGLVDTKKFATIKKDLMGSNGNGNGLNGFKMDPKTGILTGPDGKKYDPESLASKEAMAKAGFPTSAIDNAMAANNAFESEAMKKLGFKKDDVVAVGAATPENGFREGGGSGAPKYSSANEIDQNNRTGVGGGARKPSNVNKVAGLTKNFNGEKIGVAAENIFNMMTRRYKTKEKQDSFFDPADLTRN